MQAEAILETDLYTRDGIKEIRRQEARYRRMVEATLDSMVVSDLEGRILEANEIAHELYGYEPGEFIWTGGNCHVYLNHLEQAEEQLSRDPRKSPPADVRAVRFSGWRSVPRFF